MLVHDICEVIEEMMLDNPNIVDYWLKSYDSKTTGVMCRNELKQISKKFGQFKGKAIIVICNEWDWNQIIIDFK